MAGLVSIFAADILPVFLIAGAGFAVARYARADVGTLTRTVFFVLLPCLVFHMLVTSDVTGGGVGRLVAAAVAMTAVMAIVGFALARAAGLNRSAQSAFMLVVMFSNGGNYGLPVVAFAFGPDALAHATVFFLTGAVLTYAVGGFLAAAGRRTAAEAGLDVLKMPLIYAAAAAVLVKAAHIDVPPAVLRPVSLLSGAALPVMILILGMQLERAARPKRPGILVLGVATSLFVSPALALGLSQALGLIGPARQAVVLLSAMPVAVTTTIFALEYDVEPDFVTGAVFLSTILSPFTLVPLISLLR